MTTSLQVRLDPAMKKQADAIFAQMGMDTSTAVRMFLARVIHAKELPFTPSLTESERYSPQDEQLILDSLKETEEYGPFEDREAVQFLANMAASPRTKYTSQKSK